MKIEKPARLFLTALALLTAALPSNAAAQDFGTFPPKLSSVHRPA